MANYGYEGEAILLVEGRAPAELGVGQAVTIGAKLSWLVCQERTSWQDSGKSAGEECMFIYQLKQELSQHMKKEHNVRKLKISSNDKRRQNGKEGVGTWLKRRKPCNKTLFCPECGKKFTSKNKIDFEKHQQVHKVEAFICECPGAPVIVKRPGQVYNTNKEFREKERHMKVQHMGWYGCHECHVSCERKEDLEKHVESHSVNLICDSCGFEVEGSKALTKMRWHKKTVHEAKPKQCPDCGEIVLDKDMKKHKAKAHTSAGAACEICGKVVKRLAHHMQIMHMAESDKRFVCKECGKGFMDQSTMENHRMSMHIKTQPHRCRYGCENSYNDVSNRNAHERRRHGGTFSVHILKNGNVDDVM